MEKRTIRSPRHERSRRGGTQTLPHRARTDSADARDHLMHDSLYRALNMIDYFRMLARYNRIANERIYETCAQLDVAEYRRERPGSFGSIHGLLNHILLGNQFGCRGFGEQGEQHPHSIPFCSRASRNSDRRALNRIRVSRIFLRIWMMIFSEDHSRTRTTRARSIWERRCGGPALFQPSNAPSRPSPCDVESDGNQTSVARSASDIESLAQLSRCARE